MVLNYTGPKKYSYPGLFRVFCVFRGQPCDAFRSMPEKAVDECEELDPINVFNAVTRQNAPSPSHKLTDGGSVGGGWEEQSSSEHRVASSGHTGPDHGQLSFYSLPATRYPLLQP